MMYGFKGEVPDGEHLVPLGKADVKRDGTDVVLVTWGKQVHHALAAAESLAREGISAMVLDLRSLRPLDHDALFQAVAKTHRVVVVQEGFTFAGMGAEIAARVTESCFDLLDGPVVRVTNRDVPQPYATNLEKLVAISPDRIAGAARAALGRA
jgi:pyruvate dehydrogenase E1 component beta subunit